MKDADPRPSVASLQPAKSKVTAEPRKFRSLDKTPLETISGDGFEVQFDMLQGTIHKLTYNSTVVIPEGCGPKLNTFRAFVNNDNWTVDGWFANGLHNLRHSVTAAAMERQKNGSVLLTFTVVSQAPNAARLHGGTASGHNRIEELTDQPFGEGSFKFVSNVTWTVWPDGSIELASAITSNRPKTVLGRLGYVMEIPDEYNSLWYYGRGPVENYNDRMANADIASWTLSKDDQPEYTFPQECGNHEGTRWLSFTNDKNVGALIIASAPRAAHADEILASHRCVSDDALTGTPAFSFSLSPWSALDLTLAAHPYQLPKSNVHYLTIDAKVTGLGGNSCGQGGPLFEDRALSSPTLFGFIIRPASAKETYNVSPSTPFPAMPVIPKPENSLDVVFASSVEPSEGSAEAFSDGDPSTFWHTMYSITMGTYPHWVDFDAGREKVIKGCTYTPRQDGSPNGRVRDYEIYVSLNGKDWGSPVAKGSFPDNASTHKVLFAKPVKARYIRFTALSEQRGAAYACGAEFTIIE